MAPQVFSKKCSGDMYLFLWVDNSVSSSIVGNFLVDFLETLVILSVVLLPTKSPAASAVFCIALLEEVFIASVADFVAVSTSFFPCLLLLFISWLDWISHFYTMKLHLTSFNYHCQIYSIFYF